MGSKVLGLDGVDGIGNALPVRLSTQDAAKRVEILGVVKYFPCAAFVNREYVVFQLSHLDISGKYFRARIGC